jgi:spermidine synthase
MTDEEMEKMDLKYYNPDVHRASFVLPRNLKKKLALD